MEEVNQKLLKEAEVSSAEKVNFALLILLSDRIIIVNFLIQLEWSK